MATFPATDFSGMLCWEPACGAIPGAIKRLSSHLPGHGNTRIFHSAEGLRLHSLDEMPNALDSEEA